MSEANFGRGCERGPGIEAPKTTSSERTKRASVEPAKTKTTNTSCYYVEPAKTKTTNTFCYHVEPAKTKTTNTSCYYVAPAKMIINCFFYVQSNYKNQENLLEKILHCQLYIYHAPVGDRTRVYGLASHSDSHYTTGAFRYYQADANTLMH